MSVKQIIRLENDVATDREITIPFEFGNIKSVPAGKKIGDSIVITPITVRTWMLLKPLLLQIDDEDKKIVTAHKGVEFDTILYAMMAKYDELIFEIICIGIHNNRGSMPTWFRDVLKDNCTWQDLYILLNAILFRIGCNPFSNTITALQAVSPLSEEEIIALQRNNETWKNPRRKVASCS